MLREYAFLGLLALLWGSSYLFISVAVAEIMNATGIDDVREMDGASLAAQPDTLVALGPWPRPVRVDGLSVLFVEKGTAHEPAAYRCIDKQRLKAFRP